MVEDVLNLMNFIHRGYGIPVELKEGHNGIFEISMNGKVIYNNNNTASMVPTEAEVIEAITRNSKYYQ